MHCPNLPCLRSPIQCDPLHWSLYQCESRHEKRRGRTGTARGKFLRNCGNFLTFHIFCWFFINLVPILDFLGTFLPCLLLLLQILAIYTCRDHALFAVICGPPKSDRGKFVYYFMSVCVWWEIGTPYVCVCPVLL